MIEELNKLAKAMRDMSDMVGDHHWMAAKAVEGLIRLRGEITNRDARIVELERYEHAFNEWHDKTEWVQSESSSLSAKYLGCHRADVMRDLIDQLRAELAAIKAPARNITAAVDAAMIEMANISPPMRRSECERLIRAALYAAPVPEAKAQGVVMPEQIHRAKGVV